MLSTIIAIIIAFLLTYEFVYKFYSKVKLYPRGPMPLPIVGNCLMLAKHTDRHPTYTFQSLAKIYGDVYTLWLASKPIVIISGINVAKEAFNKIEFCDRCDHTFGARINDLLVGGHNGFIVMNVSEELQTIRKLSMRALRTFLSSNKLSEIIHSIVNETVEMIALNECDTEFVPFRYMNAIIIRTLVESTYSKRIAVDSELIEQISLYFESVQKSVVRLFVEECVPLSKHLFAFNVKYKLSNDDTINKLIVWYKQLNKQKQNTADNTNNTENIAESLISIANNLRARNHTETNDYLNESNIIGTIIVLFFGASDTSHNVLKWVLLLMAYYPEMQQKMREEINSNIGNNFPDVSHKEKCVYVNAFLCETLRFRNVTPLSFIHMTNNCAKIGDISIPKGTAIILNQFSILNDRRYWKNPDSFSPERFIDSETQLIKSDLSSFIPFGTGRRVCVGDRFATNMLFLVLTSLLQATNGKTFVLSDKHTTRLEPMISNFLLEPKEYKVALKKD